MHDEETMGAMPNLHHDAEQLQHEIEAAFANVQYPGDERLVYDASGYHLECNEVLAAFKGKHWKDVSLETLLYHSDGVYSFTPEAYRFYLPAYLLAGSLDYDRADMIPFTVVMSLIPPPDARDLTNYRLRMEGFTPGQRRVIKSFLEFLKRHYSMDDPLGDIDRALQA